jgi:anaerobic selenocysteine-containing dehydrogenase
MCGSSRLDLAWRWGDAGLERVRTRCDKRAVLAAVVKDLKAAERRRWWWLVRGSLSVQCAGCGDQRKVTAVASHTKPVIDKSNSGVDALKTLTGEMSSGQVSTLFILGGNPAYTAPADLQFGVALSKVANSIHLGGEDDETAAAASWHIPQAHILESWGDEATSDGLAAIQQPMIEPMYGATAEIVSGIGNSRSARYRQEETASEWA